MQNKNKKCQVKLFKESESVLHIGVNDKLREIRANWCSSITKNIIIRGECWNDDPKRNSLLSFNCIQTGKFLGKLYIKFNKSIGHAQTTNENHIYSLVIIKHKNQTLILSSGKDNKNRNKLNIHRLQDLDTNLIKSNLEIIL